MPIQALSQNTIRLLGSPLVVTSPVSLVKELLENSIDAGATSVEILISPNTVDKIEVRDNGEGICSDDYDTLGRRGHTSKLSSFEDLRTIGGKSYGFRGEALAGANALGTVAITTRTSRDRLATTLHLVPGDGGIAKQQSASAPVGTTVSVAALFARLPVREQLAMKERQKAIMKIKELLPSYALARPNLRISFKVLKMDRMGWSYAPRPQARVQEAVLQIFGSGLASQYVFVTNSLPIESSGSEDGSIIGDLELRAFLPKPKADPSKLSKGAYISVDSRPVNPTRGTMRKLVSAFKTHLSTAMGDIDSTKPVRDSFMQLDILCPTGWYDPNVEPSKDDVIFSDERKLLDAFNSLCAQVYTHRFFYETLIGSSKNYSSPGGHNHEDVTRILSTPATFESPFRGPSSD
ncbi:putative dna mismatch repair protein mutl protein [Phaeoacremonium minimum UCRPA7]|uniref:Putative dna mismatch repair protein mutl protein n=1 Tax=Phaeoacremonium minimum (strain UCR-PA7) TaxID=1286976 RepID=R8BC78_PHAM7|nr:putative dna mismatch repair protein mutl protein [Phaeoacremonium minimum UCRPA7]EON96897.1 putative dna mismatch repair protein mutl protein [Phaeoacremonium minimum UCRPA7]